MKSILFIIVLFIFSGCNSEPPEAEVLIDDEDVEISTFRGSYHWTDGAAEYDLPPQIVSSEGLEPVNIESSAVGSVVFDDGSEPEIQVSEWSGNTEVSELEVENRDIFFPEESGQYILEISAEWEGDIAKSASYIFHVEIS